MNKQNKPKRVATIIITGISIILFLGVAFYICGNIEIAKRKQALTYLKNKDYDQYFDLNPELFSDNVQEKATRYFASLFDSDQSNLQEVETAINALLKKGGRGYSFEHIIMLAAGSRKDAMKLANILSQGDVAPQVMEKRQADYTNMCNLYRLILGIGSHPTPIKRRYKIGEGWKIVEYYSLENLRMSNESPKLFYDLVFCDSVSKKTFNGFTMQGGFFSNYLKSSIADLKEIQKKKDRLDKYYQNRSIKSLSENIFFQFLVQSYLDFNESNESDEAAYLLNTISYQIREFGVDDFEKVNNRDKQILLKKASRAQKYYSKSMKKFKKMYSSEDMKYILDIGGTQISNDLLNDETHSAVFPGIPTPESFKMKRKFDDANIISWLKEEKNQKILSATRNSAWTNFDELGKKADLRDEYEYLNGRGDKKMEELDMFAMESLFIWMPLYSTDYITLLNLYLRNDNDDWVPEYIEKYGNY